MWVERGLDRTTHPRQRPFLTRIEPSQGATGLHQVGGSAHEVSTIDHQNRVVRQNLLHELQYPHRVQVLAYRRQCLLPARQRCTSAGPAGEPAGNPRPPPTPTPCPPHPAPTGRSAPSAGQLAEAPLPSLRPMSGPSGPPPASPQRSPRLLGKEEKTAAGKWPPALPAPKARGQQESNSNRRQ